MIKASFFFYFLFFFLTCHASAVWASTPTCEAQLSCCITQEKLKHSLPLSPSFLFSIEPNKKTAPISLSELKKWKRSEKQNKEINKHFKLVNQKNKPLEKKNRALKQCNTLLIQRLKESEDIRTKLSSKINILESQKTLLNERLVIIEKEKEAYMKSNESYKRAIDFFKYQIKYLEYRNTFSSPETQKELSKNKKTFKSTEDEEFSDEAKVFDQFLAKAASVLHYKLDEFNTSPILPYHSSQCPFKDAWEKEKRRSSQLEKRIKTLEKRVKQLKEYQRKNKPSSGIRFHIPYAPNETNSKTTIPFAVSRKSTH